MRTRLSVGIVLLALLLPLGLLVAGLPQFDAETIEVGKSPQAVAVTPDDRIVAVLLGTASVTVSWIDTADFSSGPYTVGLDADEAHAIVGGTLDGDPVVFVAGSRVDVIRYDVSGIPAVGVDEAIGLGFADSASLVDLAWDASTSMLYGVDAANSSLRRVDFSGDDPSVDGTGWPVELGFVPVAVAQLDEVTLLVVGATDVAAVDVSDGDAPDLEILDVEGPDDSAVDIATDGADIAWVLFESSGAVWILDRSEVVGDDDDSAGDDDDSAGDDDDSAGDDDDSAGDDDDSAADDDDSAADDDDSAPDEERSEHAGPWTFELWVTEPGAPGAGLVYRTVDGLGYLYLAGGNRVTVCDLDRVLLSDFALSSDASGIAASSGDDGFIYVPQAGDQQLAVIGSGPFVRISELPSTEINLVDDSITVTFSVDFGIDSAEVCDYRFEVDATIDSAGTAIESAAGQATDDEEIVVELTGAELPSGEHTMFIFCEDADGDDGRASFAYSSDGLSAPTGLTLTADAGEIALSWDDDGTVDAYVVYFDVADFEDDVEPDACNNDDTICSGQLVIPDDGGDDDDDATTDDDDSSTDDDATTDDDDDTSGTSSLTIDELTNGARYYFAVAARSSSGVEGPRTSTRSAVPSRRGGAAVLAGDTGGCSCQNSLAAPGSSAFGLLLLLMALARRRNQR